MIEVPANYFGKGEMYFMQEDSEEMQEFIRKFDEYVVNHPDDPTGEQALADYNEKCRKERLFVSPRAALQKPASSFVEGDPDVYVQGPIPYRIPHPRLEALEKVSISVDADGDEVWKEIKLIIPEGYYVMLKNYAAVKRRRPRDVVMKWINEHCKLNEKP